MLLAAVPARAQQPGKPVSRFPGEFANQPQDTNASTRNLLFLLNRASPSLDPLRQSIMTGDPALLDSIFARNPHLRRILLQELMTTPPPRDWLAVAHDSLSGQLYRYSRLSEFDRMSLAAGRNNELFGNQLEMRNRFYQTDVIKVLRWINTLLH